MNNDSITQAFQDAIAEAQQIAITRHQQEIDIPHLFKYLVQPGNLGEDIYQKAGLNLKEVNEELDHEIDQISSIEGNVQYGQTLSQNLFQLMQKADELKKQLGDEFVAVDTLILALMDLQYNPFKLFLENHGITKEKLKQIIDDLRGGEHVTSKNQEEQYKALEKYGVDLVKQARSGKQDPIIGRDDEIRDVIRILSRKSKNNPVLIGEPGVGKTAIVEGLAQRIAKNDVPENLKNKTIFSLDMGSLIAGAKYRGEFEDQLRVYMIEPKVKAVGEIGLDP